MFCGIANGVIPAKIVHENSDFVAFLDIAPLSRGHTLVIPKQHFRWVWDVPNFGNYWEFAKEVAKLQMSDLGARFVEFLTHGTEIEHAHIWVVPIYGDECFIDVASRKKFSEQEMLDIASKMRSQAQNKK